MTVTITRTPRTNVVLMQNECTNPSFYTTAAGWGSIGGYGTGGTGIDKFPTAINWSPYGIGALQKQWTAAPSGNVNSQVGFRYPMSGVGVGVTRTLSARVITSWNANVLVRANYTGAAGLISSISGTAMATGPNNWVRPYVTSVSPAGTTGINFEVVVASGSASPPADGLITMQTAMSTTTGYLYDYFDGDTYAAGSGTQSTKWTGTAYQSQSQLLDWNPDDVMTPQLILGYDVAQQSRNVIHQLIDGTVAAALYPASGRQGTLKLFFLDAASADAARGLMAQPSLFDLRDTDQSQEGTRFAVDGAVRKYQSDNRMRWTLEVPYREIG